MPKQSTDAANAGNNKASGVTRRDDDVNRGAMQIDQEAREPRDSYGTGEKPTPDDRAGSLT